MQFKSLTTAAAVLTMLGSHRAAAQSEPIPGLDRYVDEAMRTWQVPGLAIAFVRNDSVLLARGYGVLEVGQPARVTDQTVFAIASLTKAFTAAAAGILVDRGAVGWDTLTKTLLPDFRLRDAWVTEHITLRDMLAHRTGLTSGDWLRLSGQNNRAEILRQMRLLDFDSDFRSRYLYNNLMYLAAGEAVAARAGRSWDVFVRDELFVPLRMLRSGTSVCALREVSNVALPHEVTNGKPTVIPRLNLDNAAPVGGITASVSDMANWLRMQLADGEFGGKRLLSHAALAEMHRVQMPIAIRPVSSARYPGVRFMGYGMGWSILDYRGEKLVRHSGWIDGFRSEAALLPDQRVGIVVLSNRGNQGFANDLPDVLRNWILDRVLVGASLDWSKTFLAGAEKSRREEEESRQKLYASRGAGSRTPRALSAYAGTYSDSLYGHAVVRAQNGRLTLWFGPRHSAPLEYWDGERFMARWENPSYGEQEVTFSFVNGVPTQLESGGIVFRRKSNETSTEQYGSPSVLCSVGASK